MRQVEELIKNSPLPSAASASSDVRTPLRETTVTDVSVMSDIIRAILHSLVTRMHLFSLVVVENDPALYENWLEHKPVNTVDNGKSHDHALPVT